MNQNNHQKNRGCTSAPYGCPIGELISQVWATFGAESEFRRHMRNSKIELLKAIRSIIDKKIEDLEKHSTASKKRACKVEID